MEICRGVRYVGMILVIALTAMPASGQQTDSGLVVKMTTSDRQGRAHAPDAKVPFRISLVISDAKTGQLPSGLKLGGWIRPVADSNGSCEDTARSLRVTRGTPRGVTDLNGELIAVVNDDGSFGVVDRRLDQNGANMIAAATLEHRPDAIAYDQTSLRAFAALSEAGRIEEVDLLTGATRAALTDLLMPTDVRATAKGNLWIAESGRNAFLQMTRDGKIAARLSLPSAGMSRGKQHALFLRDTGSASVVGAFSTDGRLALIDDWTSAVRWNVAGPPVSDARFIGDASVVALPVGAKAIDVHYTDGPGQPVHVPIGIDASRLAVAEDGHRAIAYTPGEPLFAVIDLATSQVIEAGQMREGMAVQEAAFIGKNLYLLSETGGYIAIIEVAALGRKDRSEPRIVGLAKGQSIPGGPGSRIVPLDQSRALIVDRAGSTGLILHDAMAIGNVPPEDYVRLRSGVPLSVGVVDRSIREIGPGRLETIARIESSGEHELILTTGVGGLTTCIRFMVDGASSSSQQLITLAATPRDGMYHAGKPETVDFEFRQEGGEIIAVPNARFVVASLQSPWMTTVDAQRDEDRRLAATINFPHPGLFSISPLGIPPSFELREPVLTQVAP